MIPSCRETGRKKKDRSRRERTGVVTKLIRSKCSEISNKCPNVWHI